MNLSSWGFCVKAHWFSKISLGFSGDHIRGKLDPAAIYFLAICADRMHKAFS